MKKVILIVGIVIFVGACKNPKGNENAGTDTTAKSGDSSSTALNTAKADTPTQILIAANEDTSISTEVWLPNPFLVSVLDEKWTNKQLPDSDAIDNHVADALIKANSSGKGCGIAVCCRFAALSRRFRHALDSVYPNSDWEKSGIQARYDKDGAKRYNERWLKLPANERLSAGSYTALVMIVNYKTKQIKYFDPARVCPLPANCKSEYIGTPYEEVQ